MFVGSLYAFVYPRDLYNSSCKYIFIRKYRKPDIKLINEKQNKKINGQNNSVCLHINDPWFLLHSLCNLDFLYCQSNLTFLILMILAEIWLNKNSDILFTLWLLLFRVKHVADRTLRYANDVFHTVNDRFSTAALNKVVRVLDAALIRLRRLVDCGAYFKDF